MALVSELATNFAENERPEGNLLDGGSVLAQTLAAVKFYAGYSRLAVHTALVDAAVAAAELAGGDPFAAARAVVIPAITSETDISVSEWAVIRPLFLLYIERETAIQIEASRVMGLDPFGRSTSEVANDIAQAEQALPALAFSYDISTV